MKVVIRPQRLIRWISFQSMYGSQWFAVGEREISILMVFLRFYYYWGGAGEYSTYYVHKKEKSHVHLLHIAL